MRLRRGLAIGLGSWAMASPLPLPAQPLPIQGMVELQPPFPLPQDSQLDVQLLELATAGGPNILVGRQQLQPRGRSPYPFQLPLRAGAIVPGRRYELRALLHQRGRWLFRSERGQPLPRGTTAPLQLTVLPVADAPLRGLTWLRAPAASTSPPPGAPRQEQQFRLDPLSREWSGSADCNRIVGRFRSGAGQQLQLEPLAGTMQLCEPAVMAEEQRFLTALRRVSRWRLDGQGRLELLDSEAGLLLRMETRSP